MTLMNVLQQLIRESENHVPDCTFVGPEVVEYPKAYLEAENEFLS